jgi:hypothetical protein
VRDVVLYAARFERWRDTTRQAIASLDGEVIASAGHNGGLSALLAAPGTLAPEELRESLDKAGAQLSDLTEIGSHAERFRVKS